MYKVLYVGNDLIRHRTFVKDHIEFADIVHAHTVAECVGILLEQCATFDVVHIDDDVGVGNSPSIDTLGLVPLLNTLGKYHFDLVPSSIHISSILSDRKELIVDMMNKLKLNFSYYEG